MIISRIKDPRKLIANVIVQEKDHDEFDIKSENESQVMITISNILVVCFLWFRISSGVEVYMRLVAYSMTMTNNICCDKKKIKKKKNYKEERKGMEDLMQSKWPPN